MDVLRGDVIYSVTQLQLSGSVLMGSDIHSRRQSCLPRHLIKSFGRAAMDLNAGQSRTGRPYVGGAGQFPLEFLVKLCPALSAGELILVAHHPHSSQADASVNAG